MSYTLVLIRHGESEWNLKNLFTGWSNPDLSETGHKEAIAGGQLLKKEGFTFDVAYTSYLQRAIHTLNHVLQEMDLEWIPVVKNWRLNERHYGALQGLNKSETAAKYGEDQVKIWRRSFDVPPPALTEDDDRNPRKEARYANEKPEDVPLTESLKITIDRVVPYWENVIKKDVAAGKKVVIAAHGNSLRALVKYLDNISDADIVGLNIPTGVPLVYTLDENFKPIEHHYLGDQEAIAAKINAVKNQGAKK